MLKQKKNLRKKTDSRIQHVRLAVMIFIVQNTSEDQEQNLYEDMSRAYSKLEHDYEKFLSECGMSKWGYRRGGFRR